MEIVDSYPFVVTDEFAECRSFYERRFGVIDPAGMWIDVVEQIEPADGWWDRYLGAS